MSTTFETVEVSSAATGALSSASSVTMISIRIDPSNNDFREGAARYSTQGILHIDPAMQSVLVGKEHPLLVDIWDNDSDAIFDSL